MGFRRLAHQVERNPVDVALIAYLDTCQVEAGDGREFTAYGLDVRLVYRELRDGKGIGTNVPGLAIDQVVLMAVKELSRLQPTVTSITAMTMVKKNNRFKCL